LRPQAESQCCLARLEGRVGESQGGGAIVGVLSLGWMLALIDTAIAGDDRGDAASWPVKHSGRSSLVWGAGR